MPDAMALGPDARAELMSRIEAFRKARLAQQSSLQGAAGRGGATTGTVAGGLGGGLGGFRLGGALGGARKGKGIGAALGALLGGFGGNVGGRQLGRSSVPGLGAHYSTPTGAENAGQLFADATKAGDDYAARDAAITQAHRSTGAPVNPRATSAGRAALARPPAPMPQPAPAPQPPQAPQPRPPAPMPQPQSMPMPAQRTPLSQPQRMPARVPPAAPQQGSGNAVRQGVQPVNQQVTSQLARSGATAPAPLQELPMPPAPSMQGRFGGGMPALTPPPSPMQGLKSIGGSMSTPMMKTNTDAMPLLGGFGFSAYALKKGGDAGPACPFAGADVGTASSEKRADIMPYLRAAGAYLGRGASAVSRPAATAAQAARNAPTVTRTLPGIVGGIAGNVAANKADVGPTWDLGPLKINPLGAIAGTAGGMYGAKYIPQAVARHTSQIPGMAYRGLAGQMTAESMGGPATWGQFNVGGDVDPRTGQSVGGYNLNPLGILAGGAMGSKGFQNSALGRTVAAPFRRAAIGSIAGSGVDATLGMAGIDTARTHDSNRFGGGRFSQLGGWGGLASGFGTNRFMNVRDQIANRAREGVRQVKGTWRGTQAPIQEARNSIQALNSSVAGKMHQAGNFLDHTWHGGVAPFNAVGNAGKWLGGKWTGNAPNYAKSMMPAKGLGRQGYVTGAAAAGIPLAGVAGGAIYNHATGKLDDAVNRKAVELAGAGREEMYDALDQYLGARGMINQQGKFDPTLQVGQNLRQFTDPMLGMMGYDTQNMTGGQRVAGIAGPAMAAGGLMSGNPLLTLGGLGTAAYPHLAGHGRGRPDSRHGTYRLGGQNAPGARDEFQAQVSRQRADQPTGQGYL